MNVGLIPIIMLALIPTLAEAQSSRGERQRTPEQEARQEARREACREEAGTVFTGTKGRSREVIQRYVQDCMQRNR